MRYLGKTVRQSLQLLIQLNPYNSCRWSFNVTLLIAGIFGLAAGGSQNFLTLASLLAVLGVGVGGNLPVDSAVFLGKTSLVVWHALLNECSRFRSWVSSILANRAFYLVVAWTAFRQSRQFHSRPD